MKRLRFLRVGFILMAGFSFGTALAQPSEVDLRGIYDAFNSTIKAGDLPGALRLRTHGVRSQIEEALRDPSQKDEVGLMLKSVVPDTYEVNQSDLRDAQSTLYMTGTFRDPKGKPVRQEFFVEFAKEGGAWKMGMVTYTGGNPEKIKRSKDASFEPESRFDFGKTTSVGGRIVDVAFEHDHTRVTIRVLDEEIMLFLPPKAGLKKWGLEATRLKPGALIEAEGHTHKTNAQKVLATSAKMIQND